MSEENEKIRMILQDLIDKFKEYPNRWANETEIHYEFFSKLFDYFNPEDIRKNFRWEYRVGVPEYGTGSNHAKVDLCYFTSKGNFIGIEIEGPKQSPGDKPGGMKDEIRKCISKLRTAPDCCSNLELGYVVPFYYRKDRNQLARGYGKTYGELIEQNLQYAKKILGESQNIMVLEEGIIFGN